MFISSLLIQYAIRNLSFGKYGMYQDLFTSLYVSPFFIFYSLLGLYPSGKSVFTNLPTHAHAFKSHYYLLVDTTAECGG